MVIDKSADCGDAEDFFMTALVRLFQSLGIAHEPYCTEDGFLSSIKLLDLVHFGGCCQFIRIVFIVVRLGWSHGFLDLSLIRRQRHPQKMVPATHCVSSRKTIPSSTHTYKGIQTIINDGNQL